MATTKAEKPPKVSPATARNEAARQQKIRDQRLDGIQWSGKLVTFVKLEHLANEALANMDAISPLDSYGRARALLKRICPVFERLDLDATKVSEEATAAIERLKEQNRSLAGRVAALSGPHGKFVTNRAKQVGVELAVEMAAESLPDSDDNKE